MSFGGAGFGQSGFGSTSKPGAFGSGAAFGGSTGGFGASSQPSPGFGTGTGFSAGSGFGTGTGFGASTNKTTPSLFGSSTAPKSPFGASATTPSATTSSLFGSGTKTNTTGGFGSTAAPTSGGFGTGTAFGGAASGGTGLLGSSNTGTTGGFGSATTPATGTGIFGSSTAAPSSGTGFGGFASQAAGSGTALGGPLPPPEGTANPPFNAVTERDNSNVTSHYQSITVMPAYAKYSFEELRLADYNHNRRFANAAGTGPGFGTSTGFGTGSGFGAAANTGTGFGSAAQNNTTPFGSSTANTTGGFGSATQQQTPGFGQTNPLFGSQQNKPAGTGIFGSSTTTPAAGGGFGTGTGFGASANNTPAFGSTANNTGGLGGFGAAQNKPAFGASTGFGTGSGFGASTTGTNTTPFGQASTQPSTGFGSSTTDLGGFGQNNQQQQQQQQNKPLFGSGFGATNNQQTGQTGGSGLFGSTPALGSNPLGGQQQQNTGILGGGANNTGTPGFGTGGGGLFGSANTQQQGEQKPAFGGASTTGGGLFGGAAAGNTSNTGGGLFGNLNNNNNQQSKPLFGASTTTPSTGTGLFGGANANTTPLGGGTGAFGASTNNNNQNQGGGLFGSSVLGGGLGGANNNQQQNQGGGLFGSTLGATQNQQQQQPQALHASVADPNPYGSQSIFSNIQAPAAPPPGPLATPLNASVRALQRAKAPMAYYNISPAAVSRLATPPLVPGYGFSYSVYGSAPSYTGAGPYSAPATVLSPAASFLGNNTMRSSTSLGKSLNRTMASSTMLKSSVRQVAREQPGNESVLTAPKLLLPPSRYRGLKQLNIDRSLSTDIFGGKRPITNGEIEKEAAESSQSKKKKVSFDPETTGGEEPAASAPSPADLGYLRSPRSNAATTVQDGEAAAGAPAAAEAAKSSPVAPKAAEPAKEEAVKTAAAAAKPNQAEVAEASASPEPTVAEPKLGEYWMKPSRRAIRKLPREEQKAFVGFTVGRVGMGQVVFDAPVDLTAIDLDDLFVNTVKIERRTITVYPDERCKPAQGKGLNVPSTLSVQNVYPRKRGQMRDASEQEVQNFIKKLKAYPDTEFVSYDPKTHTWVFKVQHYTTYGLDDEEDEEEDVDFGASTNTLRPFNASTTSFGDSIALTSEGYSMMSEDPDDTFDFKKRFDTTDLSAGADRSGRNLFGFRPPQTSGSQSTASTVVPRDDSPTDVDADTPVSAEGSFLDERSTGSSDGERQEAAFEVEIDGSVPHASFDARLAVERPSSFMNLVQDRTDAAKSVFGADGSFPVLAPKNLYDSGNWADQLSKTISPRKQNREALKEMQASVLPDEPILGKSFGVKPKQTNINTSLDLMNSLFGESTARKSNKSSLRRSVTEAAGKNKNFEFPYAKRAKTTAENEEEMPEAERAFHESFKPRFSQFDNVICEGRMFDEDVVGPSLWTETAAIVSDDNSIGIYKFAKDSRISPSLTVQMEETNVYIHEGVPRANVFRHNFYGHAKAVEGDKPCDRLERNVWKLCNILFNNSYEDRFTVPDSAGNQMTRVKKARLTELWEQMVAENYPVNFATIEDLEERAVTYLLYHRIEEACQALIEGGNHRLATMVRQIGRDDVTPKMMMHQIETWVNDGTWSEIPSHIRTIYTLLGGECVTVHGNPKSPQFENRSERFDISKRYNLDWIQAFGLRLWYGKPEWAPIEAVVRMYKMDFTKKGEETDPEDDERLYNPLWVILKAYARAQLPDSKSIGKVYLPNWIDPRAVTGSGLRARASFELLQHLAIVFDQDPNVPVDVAGSDKLTMDYAWELSLHDQHIPAIFILLHLSDAKVRERAIKELLARCAPTLPYPYTEDGNPNPAWAIFTRELRIPDAWIWTAKALAARSAGNFAHEVDCLINGKLYDEAHETLCRTVAPNLIIEQDYVTLARLIGGFGVSPEQKVFSWPEGGALYEDFLHLVSATAKPRDPVQFTRLAKNLTKVAQDHADKQGQKSSGTIEQVAYREMSKKVAEWAQNEPRLVSEPATVVHLPLAQNIRMLHAAEMATNYYKQIMAGSS